MSLSLAGLRTVIQEATKASFFSYTQQTSQDNQRLSLTPTTPKKRKTQIIWVKKQNLKILTIHFSKINTDHNLVLGES